MMNRRIHLGVAGAILALSAKEQILVDGSTLTVERTFDVYDEPTWNEQPRQYASFTAPGKSKHKKGKR
jgi:hypothetical protein